MEEPKLCKVQICGNSQLEFWDIVRDICLNCEYGDINYTIGNHDKHFEEILYKAVSRR